MCHAARFAKGREGGAERIAELVSYMEVLMILESHQPVSNFYTNFTVSHKWQECKPIN